MAKSAAEKKAHNDHCTSEAKRYEGIASQNQEAKAKLDKKIKKLKEAKKKLDRKMTKYDKLEQKVKRDLESNVEDSSFKGDIRDKFDKAVTSVTSDLKSDQNVHQSNLKTIDLKIAELELESGDLGSAITAALDAAKNFWNSLW